MSEDKDQKADEHTDKEDRHPPTILGWIARLVSVGMLATLIGVIVWQIAEPDQPTTFDIVVKAEDIREQDGQFIIPVEVTNEGTQTARDVSLDLTPRGGKTVNVKMPLIGHNETIVYEIAAPTASAEVDATIVSYEAL